MWAPICSRVEKKLFKKKTAHPSFSKNPWVYIKTRVLFTIASLITKNAKKWKIT